MALTFGCLPSLSSACAPPVVASLVLWGYRLPRECGDKGDWGWFAGAAARGAANLWDPCALSDSVLTETGLDPATKQAGVFGKQFPGSKSCAWTSNTKWYDLTIYSIGRTLQEIRNRPDMVGFTPTTVGPHEAVQFFEDDDTKHLNCFIAVGLQQGSVTFETQTNYSVGKQGDPCVEVRRHADDLSKYLPES
nr:DUF3558 domain-containing protein [Nocardia terpenica]